MTVTVINHLPELRKWRKNKLLSEQVVGLVPTMGAIHQGHLNLIHTATKQSQAIVVSIFVNPSQFAPHEDFDKYPRTIQNDVAAINSSFPNHEIVVFAPSVNTMYPRGISLDRSKQVGAFVEVIGLSEQLEGVTRPHFFRGVSTVVTKLLNSVEPDIVYFGQKDIQQCIVIQALVQDLLINVKMVVVPTTRDETDGLALSSRNVYLTPEQRQRAPAFYRGMKLATELFESGEKRREKLLECITKEIEKEGASNFVVDYMCLSDSSTLEEINVVGDSGAILSCAWKMGNTRLIDNVLLGFSF
ncbi:hypothetical protein BB559_000861 [Furculomyces boomerangus]|uniref:Pantoate--beta-alanine ligase n=1 Tax=Furculomyces boomerangus TaxID=61424 RepID=A0A2T9Z3U2_9FUNG|nr:hypothetical protein BB559_000861 [Furculomyces boomerangus]